MVVSHRAGNQAKSINTDVYKCVNRTEKKLAKRPL